MTTIFAMIFVLGVLIFVHELGHFLAARSIGVRVERFSLGYPPRFLSFTPTTEGLLFRLYFYKWNDDSKLEWKPVIEKVVSAPRNKGSDTEYCFALVPLGGYVKVAGYVDESLDVELTGSPDELNSKNRFQQIWFMSAGVLMNILLAIVFFTGITLHTGLAEVTDEPIVMDVTSGFPAKAAGIVSGDRILTVEGKPINKWTDLTTIVHAIPEQEITVTWEHKQQKRTAVLKTRKGPIPDGDGYGMKEVGLIGATGGYEIRGAGLGESFVNGIGQTGYWFGMIVRSLTMIATGGASMKEIGGPILIAQLAGESARAGMIALLSFTAIISINLAFINILPIPGLDGGHILLVTLEAITRRQFPLKVRMVIQQAGMAMLLLLIIVVIYNDLSRIFAN